MFHQTINHMWLILILGLWVEVKKYNMDLLLKIYNKYKKNRMTPITTTMTTSTPTGTTTTTTTTSIFSGHEPDGLMLSIAMPVSSPFSGGFLFKTFVSSRYTHTQLSRPMLIQTTPSGIHDGEISPT